MKIAIATYESNLKSLINEHFGKCSIFCVYDNELQTINFIENPARLNNDNAGCEAAEFLASHNITMAVAGRFGAKAVEILKLNHIQIVIPAKEMSIQEIINQIK